MIIIGSANAAVGMAAGWEQLQAGGSALDAVEATIREVESNPADHTVGYSGYPNIEGVVELDASIMDGAGRRSGSVGALRGYRHAITVARAVMERTPHVFIVGEGAVELAREIGMEPENLLTPEVEALWRERVAGQDGPLSRSVLIATDPEHVGGTVNVLAIDGQGRLASGVSTSGWAWKYPGRIGDTPMIGGGNYADARYGAAACTGWGEMTIRAGTARAVVASLAAGASPLEACAAAIGDLGTLAGIDSAAMSVNLVALDAAGNYASVSTDAARQYVVQTDGMSAPELRNRVLVTLDGVAH
jgi:beta-aspartyl-peptidase (threonine type)